jgi:hypothetical protein
MFKLWAGHLGKVCLETQILIYVLVDWGLFLKWPSSFPGYFASEPPLQKVAIEQLLGARKRIRAILACGKTNRSGS